MITIQLSNGHFVVQSSFLLGGKGVLVSTDKEEVITEVRKVLELLVEGG